MPTNKTTALTREAAWKAKQMYEERDERGRRRWTIMEIADFLGVGETTAYRAIKRVGPYQTLPEVKTKAQLDQEAAESKERFLQMLEKQERQKPTGPSAVEVYMQKRGGRVEPPLSPLDGGDAPEETDGTASERIARAAALRNPNRLLDELVNNKGEEQ